MKTYRVEFTPEARQDMIDYARYVAEQESSGTRALAWGMYEAVMSLKSMPCRCAHARENKKQKKFGPSGFSVGNWRRGVGTRHVACGSAVSIKSAACRRHCAGSTSWLR